MKMDVYLAFGERKILVATESQLPRKYGKYTYFGNFDGELTWVDNDVFFKWGRNGYARALWHIEHDKAKIYIVDWNGKERLLALPITFTLSNGKLIDEVDGKLSGRYFITHHGVADSIGEF